MAATVKTSHLHLGLIVESRIFVSKSHILCFVTNVSFFGRFVLLVFSKNTEFCGTKTKTLLHNYIFKLKLLAL